MRAIARSVTTRSRWSLESCTNNTNLTDNLFRDINVATYKTNEFRKGLKILIENEPYLVIESTFRKPGKGNAIYTLRMKNLVRGTVLERNYRGGESIEAADVLETDAQYLYRQADTFVIMDSTSYEQYELSTDQIGDYWKYLKDGTPCSTDEQRTSAVSRAASFARLTERSPRYRPRQ